MRETSVITQEPTPVQTTSAETNTDLASQLFQNVGEVRVVVGEQPSPQTQLTPEQQQNILAGQTENIAAITPDYLKAIQDTGGNVDQFIEGQLDAFASSGGKLAELRLRLMESADSTDDRIQLEVDRRMFVADFPAIFEESAGEDPATQTELIQTRILEYSKQFSRPVDELKTQLTPEQQQFFDEQVKAVEQQQLETRLQIVSGLAQEVDPEVAQQAADALDNHPKLVEALGGDAETVQKVKEALSSQNAETQAIEKKGISGEQLAMMALMLVLDISLNRGRMTEQLFEKFINEKITPAVMQKFGVPQEIIDQFRQYTDSESILELPTRSFTRIMESYDRYQVIRFLEDLDEEDRTTLLSGEDDHRLSKDDIQRLFLSKLREQDKKRLKID